MTGSEPRVRPGGAPQPPPPLVVAAGLVVVEALLTVMYGVVELADTRADRLVMGLTTGVFLAAYGVGLGVCAWGMHRLRPWSRSPVLLTQLILLGLAWNFRTGHTLAVAIGLAVAAVLVLAGVLHPASLDALNREEHQRRG